MSLRHYNLSFSRIHKLLHRTRIVLKACSWDSKLKSVGFSRVWSAMGTRNWFKTNVFGLLMSPVKIGAASAPSGNRESSMRMGFHGRAHLLWNFSPLKWGIFELQLQWEQFLRGKSCGEPSLTVTQVSGDMTSVPTLAAHCCWQISHHLSFFSLLFPPIFLKSEFQNYLNEGHGGHWCFLAWCKLLSFPYRFSTSVLGDVEAFFCLSQCFQPSKSLVPL